MKRIIGIIGLLGAIGLQACGDVSTEPDVSGAPVGVVADDTQVERIESAIVNQTAAYFELFDASGIADGSGNGYKMTGGGASFGDNVLWVSAIGTSGAFVGFHKWIGVTVPMYQSGGDCLWHGATNGFDGFAPYADPINFGLATPIDPNIFDGTWRPWGNNNVQSGSAHGIMYRQSSTGSDFVLGVKTANNRGTDSAHPGVTSCNAFGGPGVIGGVGLIYVYITP